MNGGSPFRQSSWNACPLKMGPIGCPETSVRNYHSTLCKIPKESRSHLHCKGSLQSRIIRQLTCITTPKEKYFCPSCWTDTHVDQKVSVHLMISNKQKKMAITEYIRNVDRAILNMVFENTVRRVNKCL
jgi:hypothetical protein